MASGDAIRIGRLLFDTRSGELSAGGRSLRLEPKAAAVLEALRDTPGIVVSRQELLDRCWGYDAGSDEALTQAVAQVRRVLQGLGEEPDLVETLARRGYRLKLQTSGAADSAGSNWFKPNRVPAKAVVILLIALVLLAAAASIAFPHGMRHFVRHALGAAAAPETSHHAP